jgi:O-antigen/teichoic acid export membrane protein
MSQDRPPGPAPGSNSYLNAVFLGYVAPVAIINLGNACAYAFQVLLARWLTPEDVGAFNALLASVTLLAAPAAVAPLAITRMLPMLEKHIGASAISTLVARTAIATTIGFVAIMAATLALAPLVGALLKIESAVTLTWFSVMMAATFIYPVAAGWFQARGRNVAMALVLGGVPILRFVIGVVLIVTMGFGVNGAIASATLPCLIIFALSVLVLRPQGSAWRAKLPPDVVRSTLRFVLPAAASTTLIYALFNLDQMLVRSLFAERESGLYSVAAVIGRIPFLLPAALAGIFFADMTRQEEATWEGKKALLFKNLAAVGFIALGLATAMAVFAEPLLRIVAGEVYTSSASVLVFSSFAMAGLALLNTIVTFGMACNNQAPLAVLLLGVAVFVMMTLTLASGTLAVAQFLLLAIWLMAAAALAIVLRRPRTDGQAA